MARKPSIKMVGRQRRLLGSWLEENWDRIQRSRIFKPEAAREASKDLGFEVTVCWLQTVTKDIGKEGWREAKGNFEPLDQIGIAALLCEVTADLCEQVSELGIEVKGAKELSQHAKALRAAR